MKNLKVRKYFNMGRRFVFSLALFLLVFAAASIVKIQAAGNVTGWLWGGTEDAGLVPPAQMGTIDGNETGVGWISASGTGQGCASHPDSLLGADTKLLIHADGNGQNFIDSSPSAHPITAMNATQSDSQSVAGGKSADFNGDPAYLEMPDSEDWNFGDKYFTIDFWVYFKDFNGTQHSSPYLMGQSNGGTAGWHCNMSWDLFYNNGTQQLIFQWYPTGCVGVPGNWQHESYQFPWNAETGKWYHIVLMKNGNELKSFVDCSQIGETKTITSAAFNSSRVFRVGWVDAFWYSNWLSGYIDELRIARGATSSYTPEEQITYGFTIPSNNSDLSGYAWSENIGWVSFNSGVLVNCPSGTCSARRNGDKLEGWARILGIKDAAAIGNSGGWQGWVSLQGTAQNGSPYGVTINQDNTLTGYGWSDELGWIKFSGASIVALPECATKTLCPGGKFTACDPTFCLNGSNCSLTGDNTWNCSSGSSTVSCSAGITSPEDGRCGTANGGSLCQGRTPTSAELCAGGKSPLPSSLNLDTYEVKWTCEGICSSVNEDCSAQGTKACGWIETNP